MNHYINARNAAITEKNILLAWHRAELFSKNMFRVLHEIGESALTISMPNNRPDTFIFAVLFLFTTIYFI